MWMNITYGIMVISLLVCGAWVSREFNKMRGGDTTSTKVEHRYYACLERGAETQTCAMEELVLRGLQCQKP